MILFLVSLTAFTLIAHEVVGENEDWFDSRVFTFFKSRSSPAVVEFFKLATFFGSSNFLSPAYVIVILILLYKKRRRAAITVGIIGIVTTAMTFLMKLIFGRQRPDLPLFKPITNFSFPSGHALSSFMFFCMLSWLVWTSNINRVIKIIAVVLLMGLCLMVGISRIVLRYHYASDVVGGFCLGIASVSLLALVRNTITGKARRRGDGS